jgi:hypothetical protein
MKTRRMSGLRNPNSRRWTPCGRTLPRTNSPRSSGRGSNEPPNRIGAGASHPIRCSFTWRRSSATKSQSAAGASNLAMRPGANSRHRQAHRSRVLSKYRARCSAPRFAGSDLTIRRSSLRSQRDAMAAIQGAVSSITMTVRTFGSDRADFTARSMRSDRSRAAMITATLTSLSSRR